MSTKCRLHVNHFALIGRVVDIPSKPSGQARLNTSFGRERAPDLRGIGDCHSCVCHPPPHGCSLPTTTDSSTSVCVELHRFIPSSCASRGHLCSAPLRSARPPTHRICVGNVMSSDRWGLMRQFSLGSEKASVVVSSRGSQSRRGVVVCGSLFCQIQQQLKGSLVSTHLFW